MRRGGIIGTFIGVTLIAILLYSMYKMGNGDIATGFSYLFDAWWGIVDSGSDVVVSKTTS